MDAALYTTAAPFHTQPASPASIPHCSLYGLVEPWAAHANDHCSICGHSTKTVFGPLSVPHIRASARWLCVCRTGQVPDPVQHITRTLQLPSVTHLYCADVLGPVGMHRVFVNRLPPFLYTCCHVASSAFPLGSFSAAVAKLEEG